jgi:hypothetical protein
VNSSNFSKITNTLGALNGRTVYIEADTINNFNVQLGITSKKNTTIDLCGGTLKYTKTDLGTVSGAVITIRNGTIEASQATIDKINNYKANNLVKLEGVTLKPTA